jgi:hypothetical protein
MIPARKKSLVVAIRTAIAIVAAGSVAVSAQEVTVSGTNTLRFEHYDTRGAIASSPYPFSLDTGYNELLLNLGWERSAYDRWRATIVGVINDSPYRSPDRDVVPERLTFSRENGDGAMPYRVEAGDFFAFTSFRTQQRPLKGASVELQPILAREDMRTSVQVFAGTGQPRWRELRWGEDNTLGMSWLTELSSSRVSLNLLRNERDQIAFGRRSQQVASVAAEAPLDLGAVRLRAEGEFATLRGDHQNGFDKRDSGSFLQLSGAHPGTTLTWRLRGERYGQDYQPFGTAITPDRRSSEAHLSWTAASALNLRARWQDFRDQFETPNPLTTQVVGVSVSGPLAALEASVNSDVFAQSMSRRDRSLDQDGVTANLQVSRSFGTLFAQASALYQKVDDHVASNNSSRTTQFALSFQRSLSIGQWQATVAPGLIWRKVSGSDSTGSRDLSATLALTASGGPHRLSLNVGRVAQNPRSPASIDVATANLGLDYRFRTGRHEFGFDLAAFDRAPKATERTHAYKAGLTWVFHFDRAKTRQAPGLRSAGASSVMPMSRGISMRRFNSAATSTQPRSV